MTNHDHTLENALTAQSGNVSKLLAFVSRETSQNENKMHEIDNNNMMIESRKLGSPVASDDLDL